MSKAIFAHSTVSDTAGLFAPASTSARTIDAMTAVNFTGAAATLTVWMVPSGGARGDDNLMLFALSILAGATVAIGPLVNHAIPANATIHAQAGTASAITLMISGRSQ